LGKRRKSSEATGKKVGGKKGEQERAIKIGGKRKYPKETAMGGKKVGRRGKG